MNAPDKVYVAADSELGFKNTKTAIAFSFEQKFDTVEYIRKDALLDFLAGLEKDSARNAGTDDLAYAAHEMVCLLINKIKSL